MPERFRPYEQRYKFSCGPASLLLAYQTLGIDYSEVRLITELDTDIDGTGWGEMFAHPLSMGLKTELRGHATWRDLQRDNKRGVVIVGWSCAFDEAPGEHFSVVNEITPDLIELADPGIPVKEWPNIMDKEQFLTKWHGKYDARTYLLIRPPK